MNYFLIYTGGNTSKPVRTRKPRTRRLCAINTHLSGARVAYFRVPFAGEVA